MEEEEEREGGPMSKPPMFPTKAAVKAPKFLAVNSSSTVRFDTGHSFFLCHTAPFSFGTEEYWMDNLIWPSGVEEPVSMDIRLTSTAGDRYHGVWNIRRLMLMDVIGGTVVYHSVIEEWRKEPPNGD